ncbi:MAG TPA: hypothetical protein VIK54_04920 [Acidimicrobiia bacterium]
MNKTFGFDEPDPVPVEVPGVLDVGVLELDDELQPAARNAATVTAPNAFAQGLPQEIVQSSRTPRT